MEAFLWDGTKFVTGKLEKDPAVIYVLDRDLRIVYCNESWDRFAAQNGGSGLERQHQLGRAVMDAIPLPLKAFFEERYQKAFSSRQSWEYSYECSSSALYRTFRTVCYPDSRSDCLVVVNSLFVERVHECRSLERVSPELTLHRQRWHNQDVLPLQKDLPSGTIGYLGLGSRVS
jgi:hypothetical protein